MKLEFSRQGLVEALIHVLIMAAAASLSGAAYPAIESDTPKMTAQDVA